MEVAGSIIGQMMAQGKQDEIALLRREAMARYGNTNLSTLEALAKEKLGPSKLGDVKMDEKYKGASDDALDRLMGISKAEGMDAQSLAKLNQAKNEAFGVERGMRGAAEQSLARRGMMNSGALVSSKFGAAQAGADRMYQGSINAAGDASQRALEALMAGGKMAQGMGQSDLQQKNLVANSDDRINEFNLSHQTNTEQALINAKLRIAAGMNGVGDQQADDLQHEADRIQQTGRGLGKAGGTQWDYMTSDIDPKTGKPRTSTA